MKRRTFLKSLGALAVLPLVKKIPVAEAVTPKPKAPEPKRTYRSSSSSSVSSSSCSSSSSSSCYGDIEPRRAGELAQELLSRANPLWKNQ